MEMLPNDEKSLVDQGYTKKQAKAIIVERKKKKKGGNAVDSIKKSNSEKNRALNDIYNW